MNDKDKEAFEKWWDDPYITNEEGSNISSYCKDAALDAWEYKQKEIDELYKYIERLSLIVGDLNLKIKEMERHNEL